MSHIGENLGTIGLAGNCSLALRYTLCCIIYLQAEITDIDSFSTPIIVVLFWVYRFVLSLKHFDIACKLWLYRVGRFGSLLGVCAGETTERNGEADLGWS